MQKFLIRKMSQAIVIRQYVYETDNWLRLLAFFIQENVSLKTRLAEVVDSILDKEDLDIIEKFQEEFLAQDTVVTFLSDELNQQVKLLERDDYEDGELFKEVVKHQKKLRREIKKAEDVLLSFRPGLQLNLAIPNY